MTPQPVLEFLAGALPAARTNAGWTPLRPLAELLTAAAPARAGTLGPVAAVDARTGLPPYEWWARVRADQQVAREEAVAAHGLDDLAALEARASTSPVHAARLQRRRYHDALRATPLVRLAELDMALRSTLPRGGRRVLAVLDKVEVDGVLVRLSAELAVDKGVSDRALFEVLFARSAAPIEDPLAALCAAAGVREVERVSRGAVDACAVADAELCPAPFDALAGVAGAAVCACAFATAALDVTAGDNDLFSPGARALPQGAPHRVYRDRKLVVTPAAAPWARAAAARAGTRTLIYEVSA